MFMDVAQHYKHQLGSKSHCTDTSQSSKSFLHLMEGCTSTMALVHWCSMVRGSWKSREQETENGMGMGTRVGTANNCWNHC